MLIAERPVGPHRSPERRFVNAGIFPCDGFGVEGALHTAPRGVLAKWKLMGRGLEFPKHLARPRDPFVRDRRAIARSLGLEASR
ncbi:MAG: hypothetical protein E6K73_10670 [Candidatus Eisenbacteria bacterium]|uniref:Uncharacterized protein n=1 Tax=Eiseniibacteriota bacterium TaxID=2212470 RepID=A0A538SCH0_UNCEI|nr:MAG: hypothetical protein E6K73_10670 [Candidatus Eisenbacteria bacterium]